MNWTSVIVAAFIGSFFWEAYYLWKSLWAGKLKKNFLWWLLKFACFYAIIEMFVKSRPSMGWADFFSGLWRPGFLWIAGFWVIGNTAFGYAREYIEEKVGGCPRDLSMPKSVAEDEMIDAEFGSIILSIVIGLCMGVFYLVVWLVKMGY